MIGNPHCNDILFCEKRPRYKLLYAMLHLSTWWQRPAFFLSPRPHPPTSKADAGDPCRTLQFDIPRQDPTSSHQGSHRRQPYRAKKKNPIALGHQSSTRQDTGTMAIDKLVTDPNLALAIQISGQSRDQANALISLAEKNGSSAGPLSPAQKAEVSKQQTLLLASIAQLRGLHRHANLAARETKAQTAEARQEVDRLHLQLQNLYYEQRHLQEEITACESYE